MVAVSEGDQQLSKEEVAVFREVFRAIRQIKHGYIHLVVQDSRVIQIDKTEKMRFKPGADNTYHI